GGLAKCASCSFVPFLSGVTDRSAYLGLDPLARTFNALGALTSAAKRGDAATVLHYCAGLGARSVYEVVATGEPRLLPELSAVSKHGQLGPRGSSWALVEPGPDGPSGLAARLHASAASGYRRIVVGYLDHAVATEHWSHFVERENFGD